MKEWTTPTQLRAQVQKLWDRGEFLAGQVDADFAPFPKRLLLKGPSSSDLSDRFEEARTWSRQLCEVRHIRIELREFKHRSLGQNAVPNTAWLDDLDAAASLLNKRKEVGAFALIIETIQNREPSLLQWLQRYPLKALDMANDWSRLLDVISWMRSHPNPNIYLRQIDIAGVHSKFIERYRAILTELIDIAAPQCVVLSEAQGISRFSRRYGFKEKPERIRFRMLDSKYSFIAGVNLRDVELDAESFALLNPNVKTVFITENEVNFLAFPMLTNAMVIFGSGYGFSALGQAAWLSERRVFYWGDIDTHGFAILNELRHRFDHVESLLMDCDTFVKFKAFWGAEATPTNRDLLKLDVDELALYNDLRDQRLGANLRLEQEHIGFEWLVAAIAKRADC